MVSSQRQHIAFVSFDALAKNSRQVIGEVGVGDFSQSFDLYAWLQNSQAQKLLLG
jgi:hypothetical protein